MPTAVSDLTGQTFGVLTVVSRASDYITKDGRHRGRFTVRCSLCGNQKTMLATNLKRAKSCGCVQPRKPRRDDLTYVGAHFRVRRDRGPASAQTCACGAQAQQWAYDHACPQERGEIWQHGKNAGKEVRYSADPNHYIAMCIPCHVRFDKR